MAKGFGVKPEEQLGYVLCLMPDTVYAARLNFDKESGEEFIGVTNMLWEAQTWKKIDQAKRAIKKYADFLLEQIESGSDARVDIKKVKRSNNGELSVELVESLLFIPEKN
jgi:hypothetical protein